MEKCSRIKKMLSLLLCLCMVCSVISFPAGDNFMTAEAAQVLPELVASYPLLTDVKDVSGNGYDGREVGQIRYYNGITFPGNTDSSTNYVELPQGMLDGKDALTISVWLKNRTGKGNYAAVSFCSPAEENVNSPNYWMFVPSNPDGVSKNVFTNGVNENAPWASEVGVTAGDTTGLERQWAQYTLILTADSVSTYLNGELVGTMQKSRTTADFGENLLVYLGRSGYAGDQAFAGSMKDLNIYDGALTQAQIQAEYAADRAAYDLENESTVKEPEGITEYKPELRRETDEASGIIHPGIGISAEQLETMQRHVRVGDEPWLSGYEVLKSSPKARLNPPIYFQAGNDIFIHIPGPWAIEGYSNPGDFVSQRCQMDSLTAAYQSLMWYITGNEQYRKNVFTILNNFAMVESAVDHTDFRFGDIVYNLCFAAEILRYTDCDNEELQWTQEDTDRLTGFIDIVHKFYDATWFWMNQHSFNVLGMMGESIFTNDAAMYGTAVERTLVNTEGAHGGNNGSVKYQIREMWKNDLTGEELEEPNIQLMEMGRDQGHAYGNLGGLSELVESIYVQGTLVDPEDGTVSAAANAVNPFQFLDDRLLAGASYLAKFHLGYDVTWIPAETGYSSASPNGIYKSINEWPWKGNLSNYYGIVYNYYKYVEKADMTQEKYRYVAEAYESIFPEDVSGDFIGLSTLLYTPEAAASDGISRKKDYSGDTETISQTEYFSALRRGTAEIRKEGAVVFVRADAAGAGTEFAIRHYGFPKKELAALRVRSNGNATVRLGCQKPEHDPAAVFEIHDTNGQWQSVVCDLSKSQNTEGSMVYYTITGDATQVDLDYLDFAPAEMVPEIFGIRHDNTVLSETLKDGTEREYIAVGENYQAQIVLEKEAEGVTYSVQGLPENASFDEAEGMLQWKPGKEQAGKEFTLCYLAEKNGAVSYCSRKVYVYDTVYQLLEECVRDVCSGDYERVSAETFKNAYTAALEEGKRSCVSEAFKDKTAALLDAAGNLKYMIYDFGFEGSSEEEKLKNKGIGKEPLSLCGNAGIVYDEQLQSHVLSLDGIYGTFAKLPEHLLEGIDTFTVNMFVKSSGDVGRILSIGSSETNFLDISGGAAQFSSRIVRNGVSVAAEKTYDNAFADTWNAIALEVTPDSLKLYQNGELIAENKEVAISVKEIGENLSVMLGQSFSIEDANFKGCLDDIRIYRGAYGEDFKEKASLDMAEIIVKAPESPKPPESPQPATTIAVKKVALNITKATIGVGETLNLKATKTPAKAKTTYRWSSSAPKVVSVSQKGKIRAKKKGKAAITVKSANGKKAVCRITVKKAPKKVSFKKKSLTLIKGKSATLKVKLPAGSASRKLTFASNKKSVAAVSSKGKVTAKKAGTARITVKTYNGKKAHITVKVKKR